ncbi:unnamed protein product, partial [Trichogramma brassicae]
MEAANTGASTVCGITVKGTSSSVDRSRSPTGILYIHAHFNTRTNCESECERVAAAAVRTHRSESSSHTAVLSDGRRRRLLVYNIFLPRRVRMHKYTDGCTRTICIISSHAFMKRALYATEEDLTRLSRLDYCEDDDGEDDEDEEDEDEEEEEDEDDEDVNEEDEDEEDSGSLVLSDEACAAAAAAVRSSSSSLSAAASVDYADRANTEVGLGSCGGGGGDAGAEQRLRRHHHRHNLYHRNRNLHARQDEEDDDDDDDDVEYFLVDDSPMAKFRRSVKWAYKKLAYNSARYILDLYVILMQYTRAASEEDSESLRASIYSTRVYKGCRDLICMDEHSAGPGTKEQSLGLFIIKTSRRRVLQEREAWLAQQQQQQRDSKPQKRWRRKKSEKKKKKRNRLFNSTFIAASSSSCRATNYLSSRPAPTPHRAFVSSSTTTTIAQQKPLIIEPMMHIPRESNRRVYLLVVPESVALVYTLYKCETIGDAAYRIIHRCWHRHTRAWTGQLCVNFQLRRVYIYHTARSTAAAAAAARNPLLASSPSDCVTFVYYHGLYYNTSFILFVTISRRWRCHRSEKKEERARRYISSYRTSTKAENVTRRSDSTREQWLSSRTVTNLYQLLHSTSSSTSSSCFSSSRRPPACWLASIPATKASTTITIITPTITTTITRATRTTTRTTTRTIITIRPMCNNCDGIIKMEISTRTKQQPVPRRRRRRRRRGGHDRVESLPVQKQQQQQFAALIRRKKLRVESSALSVAVLVVVAKRRKRRSPPVLTSQRYKKKERGYFQRLRRWRAVLYYIYAGRASIQEQHVTRSPKNIKPTKETRGKKRKKTELKERMKITARRLVCAVSLATARAARMTKPCEL